MSIGRKKSHGALAKKGPAMKRSKRSEASKGAISTVVSGSLLNPVAVIDEKVAEGWDVSKYYKASLAGGCYLVNPEVMTFIKL